MYAVSLAERLLNHPHRDFGLYLDRSWKPTWPAAIIECPDFGIPTNTVEAAGRIREAFERARRGEWVEVGCLGGQGRTGMALACMPVLAGEPVEAAVQWVRKQYIQKAVETSEQEAWVVTFANWQRAWCYFCNIIHAVYREIRHVGPPGDREARCQIPDRYLAAARKCQRNRHALKSSVPFRGAAQATTSDVSQRYEQLTDLALGDLVDIFRNGTWQKSYGGDKWAAIAEVLIRLKSEIDSCGLEAALTTCETVRDLQHNSGPLMPSLEAWRSSVWLREKWPVICDPKS